VFGVVTPFTALRNCTPLHAEFGLNHGLTTYVFSRGWVIWSTWVPDWFGSSRGSWSFHRLRSRI
jgi:hypothetical protein